MTNDIYEDHTKAFSNVNAYVICDPAGQRVATVAFKRGQAVTCYLHIFGLTMAKGRAGGGGYDRHSAAAWEAINKIKPANGSDPECAKLVPVFKKALEEGNGSSHWDIALQKHGFKVYQAV